MNSLYQRHMQNFSRIRNAANLDDFTYHFTYLNNHDFSTDYQIVGIEKIYKDDLFRKTRERFWIRKLKTLKPYGFNVKST